MPALSADGQIVAFRSDAHDLVSNDTNGASDVFVRDRASGTTERVSVDSSGGQGDSDSWWPALSADGQVVAFISDADDLVPGDTNDCDDVFVHDRVTGLTERVSVDSSGVEGDAVSDDGVSISADGSLVAFGSDADNLVAGDTNGQTDVFVHDRSTGATERVSVDSSGTGGNDFSIYPMISANGRVVSFTSHASNLVAHDNNGLDDVFVHDRVTGHTARMSVVSNGGEGRLGNYGSFSSAISANGQFVVFASDLSDLVSGDTNASWDVFIHDRSTDTTERVSVDSTGAEANGGSSDPVVAADGTFVAFASGATNLVAGDANGWSDIFVHDRTTGATRRVSVDSSGAEGNRDSFWPAISGDRRFVAFTSVAWNLVANDTNGFADIFVHHEPLANWSNYGAGYPGTNGVPTFTSQANPVIGTTITIDLANSYANPTSGLLFVGFQQTNLPTSWGGDLLVVPTLVIPITLASGGDTFTGAIPNDPALLGTSVDLQALEADPGAAKGVSFTAGLELVLGY